MNNLSSLKNLKDFLKLSNTNLKKSLSQNFLIDPNILKKLIDRADIKEDDFVLEIGSGSGMITKALIDKKADILAVEIDSVFSNLLEENFKSYKNFKIVNEDFLKMDLKQYLPPSKKVKIVANIPYNITSPIFDKIAKHLESFSKILLFVQKEIFVRIFPKDGTKEKSSFSIFCEFYFNKISHFKISKNSFFPSPKVDSVIIELEAKKTLPLEEEKIKTFFKFIKLSFSQKRKILVNCLSSQISKEISKSYLEELNIKTNCRAEELSLEQFIKLFQLVENEFTSTF